MRRVSKGYTGVDTPLFQTMLVQGQTLQGEGSTVPVEPHHTPTSAPSTSQPPTTPPSMQTTHNAEESASMPYDSSHSRAQSLGSDEGSLTLNELTVLCTTLSKKVEGLEAELKQTYSTAPTKLVRKVKKLEQTVKASQARRKAKGMVFDDEDDEEDSSKQRRSLIEQMDFDAGISLVPSHVTGQRHFDDTHVSDQPEEHLGVFSATKVLADAVEQRRSVKNVQSYTRRRRTVSTGSDGVGTASGLVGIAELAQKLHEEEQARFNAEQEEKFEAEQEQERLDLEASVRAQEELDAEMAKQLQEEIDTARQEQEKYDLQQALDLQKYHALQNRSFSVAEVRKNMCMYLKNHGGYKQGHFKGMSYEDIRLIFKRQPAEEEKVKKNDDSSKPAGGSRKKTLARKRADGKDNEESMKKQKLEDDTKKEELKAWKADGSFKNYKIFSEMLDDFDRQDVGDLKILFEPDEEDEIWKNQQDYNLISWRLFDSYGIHVLLMNTGIAIHMMIEKKYPLTQEMLSKMLCRRLEVDHESEMAFELLRFTRSQLQK
ncbi:hypothetical protein Tco_0817510 [Tanacetum coccineum]